MDYPIEQSGKIFLDTAQSIGEAPITEYDGIESLFRTLQSRLGPWFIVDFLDMSNWDCVQAYALDRESGILSLAWHDFKTAGMPKEKEEMARQVFPASYYGCALHIQSVVPMIDESTAVFLLNGYAKTAKEIRALYKSGADELTLHDYSFFERHIVRRVAGQFEVVDFHCTPIFSLALVPKQCGWESHHSKTLLYLHNFGVAIERLSEVERALTLICRDDHDAISEKGNTVRRVMESVLKVECCFRDVRFKKEYTSILLGDLIGQVRQWRTGDISSQLGKFAERTNRLSHDSGRPQEIADAHDAVRFALKYAESLISEVSGSRS